MEQTMAPRGVNVENMKIWVDGLLSGEFEKGTGRLASCPLYHHDERGPKRLCCLGVATELGIRHGLDVSVYETERVGEIIFEYDGSHDFLPTSVRQWLGLESENPKLTFTLPDGTAGTATASALNDGEAFITEKDECHVPPYSHRQIALAIIRTYHLPGYEHLLEEADEATD